MSLPDLEALMQTWGEPAYRARQLYRQMYVNLADDISTMTDLPRTLRQRLANEQHLSRLTLAQVQQADDGLTRKALFTLPDGSPVETVLMIYPQRATVCVSTQSGCGMGCVFCATGQVGLQHNLSSGDIVTQVLWAVRSLQANPPQQPHQSPDNAPFSSSINVVFMGMGEPFANYENWWASVERLHDPAGFHLGARKMTVSTVGLVPGIRRLMHETLPINLAISLHAPDDDLRNELVPVNRRYPLDEIMQAAREYTEHTGRRVSFEYVLLKGRNDHPNQARLLAHRLRDAAPADRSLLYHINLIPWNPVSGTPLHRTDRQRVLAFQQVIEQHHIACTVRVERGNDIAAACGQLAGQHAKMTE
jgi:23S rRNA (adenine2503-C2)-methyltransferase